MFSQAFPSGFHMRKHAPGPNVPARTPPGANDFPLANYLQILHRQLPDFLSSIESMHEHVLGNYVPGSLPARYTKEQICVCPALASPETLFKEPIGMQVVLMCNGFLPFRPFLRVVILHNALVYFTKPVSMRRQRKSPIDSESLVTDLLWMLFVDTSRIAAKWDASCSKILTKEILPFPTAAMKEREVEGCDDFGMDLLASPVLNYLKSADSRKVAALQRKYGKTANSSLKNMDNHMSKSSQNSKRHKSFYDEINTERHKIDSGWRKIFTSLKAEVRAEVRFKKACCPFDSAKPDDFVTFAFLENDEVDPIQSVARLNYAFYRLRELAIFLHGLQARRVDAYQNLIRFAKRNGPMFVIAPSQVSCAGYGVYVCGSLPAGARIGAYAGVYVSKTPMSRGRHAHESDEDTGYLLHHNSTTNIDGAAVRSLAAMVNDYRDKAAVKQRVPNCRFCYSRFERCIRTTKVVKNEELLIYYGSAYKLNTKANVASLARMCHGDNAILHRSSPSPHPAAGIREALEE